MSINKLVPRLNLSLLRLGVLALLLLPLLVACGDNTATPSTSGATTQAGTNTTVATSSSSTTQAGATTAPAGVATSASITAAATKAGTPGGTLTIGVGVDITQPDPQVNPNPDTLTWVPPVLQTLTAFTADLQLVPNLAEKWTLSEDGLGYTFNLRKGVKWSNGKEMTAQDILWNFNRIRDPNTKAVLAGPLSVVSDIKATDNYTIVFSLKSKDASLPYSLALPGRASMMSPDSVGADGKVVKPIGTGPFTMESYKQGDQGVFKKNPNYWEAGYPLVDTLIIKPIVDENTRFNALQSGDIDIDEGVPIEQLGKPANPNFKIVTNRSTGGYLLLLNTKKEIFANPKVRQAVMMALDRDEINQAIFNGQAVPANQPFPKGSPWYVDIPIAKSNIDQAKAMLTEAGVAPGTKLRAISAIGSRLPDMLQVIQAELKKVGLELQVEQLEQGTYASRSQSGDYDIGLLNIGVIYEPDRIFAYFTKPSPGNWFAGFYNDPAIDQAVAQAKTELDQAKRKDLYSQILTKLQAAGESNFLVTAPSIIGVRSRVQNFNLGPETNLMTAPGYQGIQTLWVNGK
jgi:peptide/nickel transport system substrate-binding protein